jgi:hypothetical protein
MKNQLFPIAIALCCASAPLKANVLPGNTWENADFEIDPTAVGGGGWNLGGSDVGVLVWSTANSTSPTHSLGAIDNTSIGYGEWYGDQSIASLGLFAGADLTLHWEEMYNITEEFRVTVRFLDQFGSGGDNHFTHGAGSSAGWVTTLGDSSFTSRNEFLTVPLTGQGGMNAGEDAVTMRIQLVSGGPQEGLGEYLIDDLSVVLVPEPSSIALLTMGGLVVLLRRRKSQQ